MSHSSADNKTEVITTYLEMFGMPDLPSVVFPDEATIVKAEKPTLKFYRFLYDAVGAPWNWVDRKRLTDVELAKEIQDERVDVFVLYDHGVPAGYAELDRREFPDIELKYFGIMPEFIGKQYGKHLLHWIIEKAWSFVPKRFWVHTCTLDHPRALPLYEKAGFRTYKTERHFVDKSPTKNQPENRKP